MSEMSEVDIRMQEEQGNVSIWYLFSFVFVVFVYLDFQFLVVLNQFSNNDMLIGNRVSS